MSVSDDVYRYVPFSVCPSLEGDHGSCCKGKWKDSDDSGGAELPRVPVCEYVCRESTKWRSLVDNCWVFNKLLFISSKSAVTSLNECYAHLPDSYLSNLENQHYFSHGPGVFFQTHMVKDSGPSQCEAHNQSSHLGTSANGPSRQSFEVLLGHCDQVANFTLLAL